MVGSDVPSSKPLHIPRKCRTRLNSPFVALYTFRLCWTPKAAIPSSFLRSSLLAGLSGERGDSPMAVVVTALIPATGTVLDWPLDTSLALHPLVAPAQKAAEVLGRRFLRCETGACVILLDESRTRVWIVHSFKTCAILSKATQRSD